MHPFYGLVPKPKVNAELLSFIANQTGGQFLWLAMQKTCEKYMIRLINLKKQGMMFLYLADLMTCFFPLDLQHLYA